MAITAADVKKLRDLTGAGMMDSKKALVEADGDFDKAVEVLRVKGAAKAAQRGAERQRLAARQHRARALRGARRPVAHSHASRAEGARRRARRR